MSLFDQEDTFDENKDYLAELTGPGGKFDRSKYTSEADMYKAIAKGKVFADRTLDHKLKEFDELREDFVKANANATAAVKYEELKALLEKRGETVDTTPVNSGETSLDRNQLKSILAEELSALKQQEKETSNMDKVETRLKEQFGDNAGRVLKDKMNTLGLTAEDLKFLAKRSPEAVLNALGLNAQQKETYQGVPTSSFRSDNFVPQADIHDALYWEKMRRENPKEYFSEKMSVQRLKDMEHENFLTRLKQRDRQPL